jgi:hypothetical protein
VGNGSGSYRSTLQNHMKAFDKLPPTLRQALANAVFDWATQPILTLWRRDGLNVKEIAKRIAKWDREMIAKAYKRREH